MKRLLIFSLATLMATVTASAANRPSLPEAAQWLDGPAGYIMTPEEASRLAAVGSKEEFETFKKIFWARRDPNLETRINEFKVDFDARVAAADKQFAEGDTPGSLTDRGKALILLGRPSARWVGSLAEFSARTGTKFEGPLYDPYKGKVEVWTWKREDLPSFVKLSKKTKEIKLVFVDKQGEGVFKIEKRVLGTSKALKAMEQVAEATVKHPDLWTVPAYPLIPGAPKATDQSLALLDSSSHSAPDGYLAVVEPGLATEHIFPYWLFIRVPANANVEKLVGRMKQQGELLGTFEIQAQPVDTKLGKVLELMVPQPEASSTLEVGLLGGGSKLASWEFQLEPPQVPQEGTYIAGAYAGAEVLRKPNYQAGEPFVFGGYHLIIRPNGNYAKDESISYFFLVVRPGLDDSGKPKAKVRLAIYHGKKRLTGTPYRQAALSPVEPNVYMFGSQLDLNIFKKGGEFTLKVWLKDEVSGVEKESEIPIVLPEV